jgi:hypothetical protein
VAGSAEDQRQTPHEVSVCGGIVGTWGCTVADADTGMSKANDLAVFHTPPWIDPL